MDRYIEKERESSYISLVHVLHVYPDRYLLNNRFYMYFIYMILHQFYTYVCIYITIGSLNHQDNVLIRDNIYDKEILYI